MSPWTPGVSPVGRPGTLSLDPARGRSPLDPLAGLSKLVAGRKSDPFRGPIPERIVFACGLVGIVRFSVWTGVCGMEQAETLRQGKATLGPLAEGHVRKQTPGIPNGLVGSDARRYAVSALLTDGSSNIAKQY